MKVKSFLFGAFDDAKTKPPVRTGPGTMRSCWKVILWSLKAAFEGRWPDRDFNDDPWPIGSFEASKAGTLLAGGFFMVLWSLKGDLDYLAKGLHLRHYSRNEFCIFCPANSVLGDFGMNWNNFRGDSTWKTCPFTVDQWRAAHEDLHWMFTELPYVTHHNVDPDELHLLHLGTTPRLLGSIFYILCYMCMPGTPQQNLDQLWNRICIFYKRHGTETQFSNISLGSFCNTKSPGAHYPEFKGRGAEMKDLIRPTLDCWTFFAPTYEFDTIRRVLLAQIDMQGILSDHADEVFLPEGAAIDLMGATDRFLGEYSKLVNKADSDGQLLWNLTPKYHWLWHWSRRSMFLNPRRANCMLDEDFVGHMKTIVASCVSGTALEEVPTKLMEKVQWVQHFTTL